MTCDNQTKVLVELTDRKKQGGDRDLVVLIERAERGKEQADMDELARKQERVLRGVSQVIILGILLWHGVAERSPILVLLMQVKDSRKHRLLICAMIRSLEAMVTDYLRGISNLPFG